MSRSSIWDISAEQLILLMVKCLSLQWSDCMSAGRSCKHKLLTAGVVQVCRREDGFYSSGEKLSLSFVHIFVSALFIQRKWYGPVQEEPFVGHSSSDGTSQRPDQVRCDVDSQEPDVHMLYRLPMYEERSVFCLLGSPLN